MTRIMLSGCNGKMGRVIDRLVAERDDVKIVCGVDINDVQNSDYPVFTSPKKCTCECDVIIDFSHPNSLEGILNYATENQVAAVICTTGLTQAQKESMTEASKVTPIFFSANMSLGVNLLIDLAKRAAKLLEGSFDIEIVEKHHNQKIDAPSGTALAIADAIGDVLEQKPVYTYDRHSVRKKRGKDEIGIHAVRGGTIVGEHEIIFAGADEVIELKHHAASKEIFAVGAVKAAIFLKDKAPGMYSMTDLVAEI
ncbi:MAG: 4-hydroxy-tetrahydrodipicolinate reductase [Clostridia bacterium]|nr:4-hydroxy-tetrahydrodipicolinate reductase [Clostridia bacterium]